MVSAMIYTGREMNVLLVPAYRSAIYAATHSCMTDTDIYHMGKDSYRAI